MGYSLNLTMVAGWEVDVYSLVAFCPPDQKEEYKALCKLNYCDQIEYYNEFIRETINPYLKGKGLTIDYLYSYENEDSGYYLCIRYGTNNTIGDSRKFSSSQITLKEILNAINEKINTIRELCGGGGEKYNQDNISVFGHAIYQ